MRPAWEGLVRALNGRDEQRSLLLAEVLFLSLCLFCLIFCLFILRFCQADGWANDWDEGLALSGLPDLRLFPADNKNTTASMRYSGPRDTASMLAWLRTMAYNQLPQPQGKDEL